jgi:hypothetical protein
MTFKRGGLIFNLEGVFDWAESYALQPTPFPTKEGIKVYCGFRDIDGVSRIGYVLLDKDDPCKILRYSKRSVLDIGEDGHFDDNGKNLNVSLARKKEEYGATPLCYNAYYLDLL